MVRASGNDFSVGLLCSVFLHGLMAYAVFFFVANQPMTFRPPEVYSITIEGGKTLGGIAQIPTSEKKMPVAPPKASGQIDASQQAKQGAGQAPEKDAEVSLAEKEEQRRIEKQKAEEEKRKADLEKKKEAERKRAEEAKKAKQAIEDTEKQYQKSMQRYLGESTDAGGKGFGAARLGGAGMGGGVLRPPEFFVYRDSLKNHIKRGWNWYDQNAALSTVVSFRLTSAGEISNIRLEAGSGNRNYDESVLRAIEKANPAPPPPAKVYEFFKEVRMTFTPGE